MGYVTCNQFHQCLAYLGLSVSPAHMRLLEMKFGDQKGFNYLKFLDHLQPSEKLENKYQTRMAQLMTKKEEVYTEYHGIVSFVMCMLVIFLPNLNTLYRHQLKECHKVVSMLRTCLPR